MLIVGIENRQAICGRMEGEARECISTHAPLTINPDQERIAAVALSKVYQLSFALLSAEAI